MSRIHWRAVLALTASFLALLTPTLFTPLALAQSGSWVVISSPDQGTGDNELNGVAALSASDIWAVGYFNTNNYVRSTLTEHWNGTGWSIVLSPNGGSAGSSNTLEGVATVSTNNVWAVGFIGGFNEGQTLIEHWTGAAWTIVPSPSPDPSDVLNSVAVVSANDIWAVGSFTNYNNPNNSYGGLIEHWNGTTWSVVSNPSTQGLSGVTALTSNNVWAVGGSQVLHWNGSKWSIVPSPQGVNGGYNQLYAVTALSASDIWAVGTRTVFTGDGDFSYFTQTEHWNGTSWSSLDGADPNGGGSDYLFGVAALSHNDVWAVGYAQGLSIVEHWTGSYWNLVSNPNPSATQDSLQAATAIPATGDVWAIGYEAGSTAYQTLIEQCQGC